MAGTDVFDFRDSVPDCWRQRGSAQKAAWQGRQLRRIMVLELRLECSLLLMRTFAFLACLGAFGRPAHKSSHLAE